jgi:hypothetical protein
MHHACKSKGLGTQIYRFVKSCRYDGEVASVVWSYDFWRGLGFISKGRACVVAAHSGWADRSSALRSLTSETSRAGPPYRIEVALMERKKQQGSRGIQNMSTSSRNLWRTSAIVFLCSLTASCAIDPSQRIQSAQSFTPEMAGVFDVAQMSDSRAGFSRLTTSFSPDGKSGTLAYDYSNGAPSMYVKLDDCVSYTRHLLPGIMHDDAAIEQEIHEVRCRSTGSIWRVAVFRKGESGSPISASMKVATGYEFQFAVPFTSTVEVLPHMQH